MRIRPFVLAARDAIFDTLSADPTKSAWVITSSPEAEYLRTLSTKLGAEVILLPVDQAEAHRRCVADNRPEAWHEYIDNWFKGTDINPADWRNDKGWVGGAMETKVYQAELRLKEGSEQTGEFEALFATLKVRDHDGDVTVPGAFGNEQETPVAHYGHNHSLLPVGRGKIMEREGKAILDGRFFLDTQGGREHYLTVKNLGGLQQWSYAFDVLDEERGSFEGHDVRFLKALKVHEVSPVLVGAGIDTQTLRIKAEGNQGIGEPGTGESRAAENAPEGEAPDQGKPSGKHGVRILPDVLRAWVETEQIELGG